MKKILILIICMILFVGNTFRASEHTGEHGEHWESPDGGDTPEETGESRPSEEPALPTDTPQEPEPEPTGGEEPEPSEEPMATPEPTEDIAATEIPPDIVLPALPILEFTVSSQSVSLSDTEVVVYDYNGFKDAVEDSGITTVYLGVDIERPDTGLIINPGKASFTIDGYDPIVNDGVRHRLTDFNSSSQIRSIALQSNSGPKDITLRNLIIYGKNHYGPVTIYNEVQGVRISYENIEYYGPQLTYNRYGTAVYRDCFIQIGKFDGISAPGEVGEVPNVILGGTVVIEQVEAQYNEIFFVELQPGSIRFLENADVRVKSAGESGFIYASQDVDMILERGACFIFEGKKRFYENRLIKGLTLEENATMIVDITDGAAYDAVLWVDGDITVNQGCTFHIINRLSTSITALGIRNGKMLFNDPESVLIYNPGYRTITFVTENTLEIEAQQVNYWTGAGPGGFEDRPLHHWKKNDDENFSLLCSVSATVTGDTISVVSNYDDGDLSSAVAPDKDTFSLKNSRVVSFGRLPLTAEFIDQGRAIAGITKEYASIMSSYDNALGETIVIASGVTADGNGDFSFSAPDVDPDQIVDVKSTWQYLYTEEEIAFEPGILKFDYVPAVIEFDAVPLGTQPQFSQRKNLAEIIIFDSRGRGSAWKLYAAWTGYFSAGGGIPDYYGGLAYIHEDTSVEFITKEEPVLIHSHINNANNETSAVRWGENEGILLYAPVGEVYTGIEYSAVIEWYLTDAP